MINSFRRVAVAAATVIAVVALTVPSSAQPQRERAQRAHGAAICVAPGKITCAPARYAQAGDACACKDMFGNLKRGRVAWK